MLTFVKGEGAVVAISFASVSSVQKFELDAREELHIAVTFSSLHVIVMSHMRHEGPSRFVRRR